MCISYRHKCIHVYMYIHVHVQHVTHICVIKRGMKCDSQTVRYKGLKLFVLKKWLLRFDFLSTHLSYVVFFFSAFKSFTSINFPCIIERGHKKGLITTFFFFTNTHKFNTIQKSYGYFYVNNNSKKIRTILHL